MPFEVGAMASMASSFPSTTLDPVAFDSAPRRHDSYFSHSNDPSFSQRSNYSSSVLVLNRSSCRSYGLLSPSKISSIPLFSNPLRRNRSFKGLRRLLQNSCASSNALIRSHIEAQTGHKFEKRVIVSSPNCEVYPHKDNRLIKPNFENKLFIASVTVHSNNNRNNSSRSLGGISAGWVSLGVVLTFTLGVLVYIFQAESFARKQLVASGEDSAFFPPLSPEMIENYERAKAVVLQDRIVDNAISAMRTNDLMRCAIELELALEENKLSRSSLDADLRDQEEMIELYAVALKFWSDGYPLDFGKLLQLRNLLNVSSKVAEQIEAEIQSQSANFVI